MATRIKEPAADLVTLHALMGHYARQHGDVQQLRLSVNNRALAMERDGLGPEWTLPMRAQHDALEAIEDGIDRQLERLAKQHPMNDWVTNQAKGLSLRSFCILFGITGPLDRFPNVAKLWKYLGLAVVDGAAPKRTRGQKLDYSPHGRTRCYIIGESIVKAGGGGKYRDSYDTKKAYYHETRPDWTLAHAHRAAMRYAVKELLKDMWVEWRRVMGEEQAEAA